MWKCLIVYYFITNLLNILFEQIVRFRLEIILYLHFLKYCYIYVNAEILNLDYPLYCYVSAWYRDMVYS